jgi:hypothetical protein
METLSSGSSSFLDKRVKPVGEDRGDSQQPGTGKPPGLRVLSTLPTIA